MDELERAQQVLIAKRMELGLNEKGGRTDDPRPIGEILKAALTITPSLSREELLDTCRCGAVIEPVEYQVLGMTRRVRGTCPVCFPKELADQEAREKEQETERRLSRYRGTFPIDCGIRGPIDLSLFTPRTGAEKALQAARKYIEQFPDPSPPGIVIWGAPGNGKTLLAGAIATAATKNGLAVAWIQTRDWLRKIGTLETQEREHLIDLACQADLVVLEDLGSEKLTPSRAEWLLTIVDTVYRKRRKLVITTNHDPNSLEVALTPPDRDDVFQSGSRILDRLVEMCSLVQNKASSYRREIAEKRKRAKEGDGTG